MTEFAGFNVVLRMLREHALAQRAWAESPFDRIDREREAERKRIMEGGENGHR